MTRSIIPAGFALPAIGFSTLAIRNPGAQSYKGPYTQVVTVDAADEAGEVAPQQVTVESDLAFHHPDRTFSVVTLEQVLAMAGRATIMPLHAPKADEHSAAFAAFEPQNSTAQAEWAMKAEISRQLTQRDALVAQGITDVAPDAQRVAAAGQRAAEQSGGGWYGFAFADDVVFPDGRQGRPFIAYAAMLKLLFAAYGQPLPFVHTRSARHLASGVPLIEMTADDVRAHGFPAGTAFFLGYATTLSPSRNGAGLIEGYTELPLITRESIADQYRPWQYWARTLRVIVANVLPGGQTVASAYLAPETLVGLVFDRVELAQPVVPMVEAPARGAVSGNRQIAAPATFSKRTA